MSLGGVRVFRLRRRDSRSGLVEVELAPGSVLLMMGNTQALLRARLFLPHTLVDGVLARPRARSASDSSAALLLHPLSVGPIAHQTLAITHHLTNTHHLSTSHHLAISRLCSESLGRRSMSTNYRYDLVTLTGSASLSDLSSMGMR